MKQEQGAVEEKIEVKPKVVMVAETETPAAAAAVKVEPEPKKEISRQPGEETKQEAAKEGERKEVPAEKAAEPVAVKAESAKPEDHEPKKDEPKRKAEEEEPPKEAGESSKKAEGSQPRADQPPGQAAEDKPDPNRVILTSVMNKLGGGLLKRWQPRKFDLSETSLTWYLVGETAPHRSLSLRDVMVVKKGAHSRPHIVEIVTTRKTYLIQAKDEEACQAWITHLSKKLPQ